MSGQHQYELYTGMLCAVLIAGAGCREPDRIPLDSMSSEYSLPKTIHIDTAEGFRINPFTGDSILPLINSLGDTIRTGIMHAITPVEIQPEIISRPKSAPVRKGSTTNAFANKHQLKNSGFVNIDIARLKKYTIGVDVPSDVLLNSVGDTIQTGIPFPVTGHVVPCQYTPPLLAGQFRMKENARFNIQYLDEDGGLNTPVATCIFQDSRGNLWIGGSRGIAEYNGISLTYFTQKEGLSQDEVECIIEDKKGNLWIGTRGGLCRFDGHTFIQYTEKEGLGNHVIFSILEDKDSDFLWVGTFGGGLCKFTPSADGKTAEVIHYTKAEGLSNNRVTSVFKDASGQVWCGTSGGGVNAFDPPRPSFPGMFTHYTTQDGLANNWVISIVQDHNQHLWFSTFGGVTQYIPSDHNHEAMFRVIHAKDGLSDAYTWSVLEDHQNQLWISTYKGGINCLSLNSTWQDGEGSIIAYTEDEGLTHNYIWEIFEDNSQHLWLGSVGGGIMKLNGDSFSHFTEKEGICGDDIQGFFEDDRGHVWIGDNGKGFCIYRPQQAYDPATFTNYTLDSAYDGGNNRNRIFAFLQDKKGKIWFVTKGGLYNCKMTEEGQLTQFTFYQLHLPRPAILYECALEDASGSLWFGSSGGGITRFIPSSDDSTYSFFQYTEKEGLASNDIASLVEDENHTLWIGSREGGISCLLPSNDGHGDQIIHYSEKEGLLSNDITCMYKERGAKFWFGTSEHGVFQLDATTPEKLSILAVTSNEGLPNQTIWSITGDPHEPDNIWAGSQKGLFQIRIHPDQQTTVSIDEMGKPDGLKRTDFDMNAVLFDSKKNIWWGTGKGIERIDSRHFIMSTNLPKPEIYGVDVNGLFLDYHQLKERSHSEVRFDSIVQIANYPYQPSFSHKQNHLTFHFAAIEWAAPHKIRYSYRLMPISSTWSPPTREAKAEYRNLPSGTHTFQLRAIGESRQWSDPFEYTFTIRPPWWYAWWAFVMYGCLGGFILYRTYRFQLDRKLEIAERQKLIELDRIKNRLYTNITHEFRTPLTLIHGPVMQALSKNTTLDKKDVESIHRQSQRLQELINQMLELQKLEAGMLKPNYAYGEIIQMLRYLFGSFETWAGEKKISMLFSSSLQEVYMDFDKEKLTQITTNLVNNAIKHTPRNGKVSMSVSASSSGEILLIQVSDTGDGISEEDLPYIFDRFYQSKRAAVGGTGIGLAIVKNLTELLEGNISVESKLGSGSTFKLTFPITKHAPKRIESPVSLSTKIKDTEDEEVHFSTSEQTVHGKPIVLIIEDHPDVSQFIVSCLVQEYTPLTAMNGEEGLKVAVEKVPDLIISDVMMPGKDGFELTRILKKNIQTSHIPIILLTGRGDHEAMMAGIEQGADAYIVKPFDPVELELRVKKLLELRTNLSLHYRQHAITREVEQTGQVSARENDFLKKMRAFIEDHINDVQFNMDMLSHHMAMSHPQLHRKITALTGESVGKFVRSIRLSRARELLKNSDLTVSEIAYETGFSEPGYFTKVFSKTFNVTPSEYRSNPF